MTDAWIWGLMASLVLLALGTSLSAVKALHGKKLADDECTRLRVQLDVLNDPKNKETIDHQPVEAPAEDQKNNPNADIETDLDVFHGILSFIAKYHSQNIAATPTLLAAELDLDPEITLAYLWKYHNDQFVTFANGGRKPDINTPFFLSPNAGQHIKVVRA